MDETNTEHAEKEKKVEETNPDGSTKTTETHEESTTPSEAGAEEAK